MSQLTRLRKGLVLTSLIVCSLVAFSLVPSSVSAEQPASFGYRMFTEQETVRHADCLKDPGPMKTIIRTQTGLADADYDRVKFTKPGMEAANDKLRREIHRARDIRARLDTLDLKRYCTCRFEGIRSRVQPAPASESSEQFIARMVPVVTEIERQCLDQLVR